MFEPLFPVRIVAIRYEAQDVLSFLLRPLDGCTAPYVDPGAHIDVHLPNGMMRSYSLSNGPFDQRDYRVTVARDPKSRGGSNYMHDKLRAGQIIEISRPRNTFALAESAAMSVFIAGGIGVTPFVPMAARLNALGRPWRLHYCVRTRERAALLDELEALAADGLGELTPNFDEEPGGAMLNLAEVLTALPAGAHVYCCGPTGMLNAFRAGTAILPEDRVHFEYFKSDAIAAAGGFTVVLAKSGKELPVAKGRSIPETVIATGVPVLYSCEEGVCGACQTGVLEGEPDHRDMVLSASERASNSTMIICCSGSRTPRLVLDL